MKKINFEITQNQPSPIFGPVGVAKSRWSTMGKIQELLNKNCGSWSQVGEMPINHFFGSGYLMVVPIKKITWPDFLGCWSGRLALERNTKDLGIIKQKLWVRSKSGADFFFWLKKLFLFFRLDNLARFFGLLERKIGVGAKYERFRNY